MIYDFLFDGHCASDFDLVLASADGASLSESLGIATPEAITVQPILSDSAALHHYAAEDVKAAAL